MSREQRNISEKMEIIHYYNSIKTLKGAKSMTISKFKLSGHSTLDRILSHEDKFKNTDIESKRKRHSAGRFKNIDDEVYDWFVKQRSNGNVLSGDAIIKKASYIANENKVSNFKASKGWLAGFKSRYGIVFKKFHGEAASADVASVDSWIIENIDLIRAYNPKDVINIDETALYYEQLQNSSYVLKEEVGIKGKKLSKKRVTVLLSSALNGDKFPLVVIGKFQNPRCFKRVKHLPCEYYAQKSAWMTSSIFIEIMKKFNRRMINQNRKVLILLDQCPGHPKNIDCFENIKFLFLPKNTTSILQPLDLGGIIRCLKSRYKSSMTERMVLCEDSIIKKYTLLDSMITLTKCWESIPPQIIINCFKKSKIFGDQEDVSEIPQISNCSQDEIEDSENMFDDDYEATCEEENNEDLLPISDESDDSESIIEDIKVSINQMKNAVNVLREAFIKEDPRGLFDLHPIMDRVLKISRERFRQTKITSFFDKI